MLHTRIYQMTGIILGLFPLIPTNLKPYLVVLLFIVFIISKPQKKSLKNFLEQVIPLSSIFVLYSVSLIYTSNINWGITLLGRLSPLVIIPSCMFFMQKEQLNQFFAFFKKTFIFSSIILSGLIFIYLYQLDCLSGENSMNYGYSLITNEFWGINDHPIYISSYITVASIFVLFEKFRFKIINVLIFMVLLSTLLILSRKGAILSLFVSGFIYLATLRKFPWIKIGIAFSLVLGLAFLFPIIQDRFMEMIETQRVQQNEETSTGIRYIVWESAVDLIKIKPFFGYGAGSVADVLHNKYISDKHFKIASGDYNAHNQFLQISLATGLIGLTLFILSGLIVLQSFIRQNKIKAILVLIVFFGILLTESYLERQNGVIFFAIIISLCFFEGAGKVNPKKVING